MPSSPVHMLLAYRMADSLGINDKADFLLGAIAPDSVNHGMEQASEAVRYRAHIRDRDYDIWKRMLTDFADANSEHYADCLDYLKGYMFHCWTDIAWDEAVQPKIFKFLGTQGYGYDDMTFQKWQELYRFNSVVIKDKDFEECRRLVKAGIPRDIAACDAGLIQRYRDYVADDYRDKIKEETPLFLNDSHIASTIRQMDDMGYSEKIISIGK